MDTTETDRLEIGERVRYQKWEGVIRCVYRDGSVGIDWLCWPSPFFTGPYERDELERVNAR